MINNQNTPQFDIIVIGGGPAGMMAAGRAADRGAKVLLVEKTYRLGSKLLLTGGGKCNITNSAEIDDMITAFGNNGKFLYRAFNVFSNTDLINFFSSRGLPMHVESGGRVLPTDNNADGVLAVLRAYLKEQNVTIIHNLSATTLLYEAGNLTGVTFSDGSIKKASKVIIATGGKSYPATGSTGDGYEMAKQVGHTIAPLSPGLSALISNFPHIKELQGLTLKNILISVVVDGKTIDKEKGDLLFTHFGVSGPNILNLSGKVIDALKDRNKVEISLNLRPEHNAKEFDKILQKEFASFGSKTVSQYFKKNLPSSLSLLFEKLCAASSKKQCSMVSREERQIITSYLTDFRIAITGSRPIEEAMITRGGISLKEIDPKTMESRLVKGLYFCGEMINLAGITGGYNLQEAFSTGYLAGESATSR